MEPLRIALPGEVELACPHCPGRFRMEAEALDGVTVLHCPRCGARAELYDMLDPMLRRRVYHAVRDALEQRVHEQRRMNDRGYFEDEANLPG